MKILPFSSVPSLATRRSGVNVPGIAARATLVAGLLLAGQAATTRAAGSRATQMGGTVIYGTTGSIDSFIPVLSPTSILDDEVQVLLYRPLLWIGNKVNIDYSSSIASGIAVSKNNTTYTVAMRPDYKWSDGTAVTASDVQYTFNLMKTYGTKYGYYGIGGLPTLVKSFTVNSPTSFTITLTKSLNPTYFELNGLAQLRPLPSQAWKSYSISYLLGHQTDTQVLSVVDGPFTLSKFVLGQYARFARNATYSGHKASLDTYIIQSFASEQAVFAAMKTGAVQIGELGATLYNAIGQLSGLKTFDWSQFRFNFITLNFRNPKIAFIRDVKVRQALQLAINQPEMNQAIFGGYANSAYSPVPFVPSTYLSPTAKSTVMAAHYDLAKAKAILAADGWTLSNGVQTKAGQKLAFAITIPSQSQTSLRQAEIIQQDYAKIGVTVTLNQAPFSVILPLLGGKGPNWDSISIGWIYYPNFYPLGDGLFGTTGGANFGGFSDPQLDATINAAQTEPGLSGFYKYEDYAAQALPVLYLDNFDQLIKYQPSVQGVAQFFNPVFANSPEYLSISK